MHLFKAATASFALAALAFGTMPSARAGEVVEDLIPGIGEGQIHVTSMKERTFANVVRQQSDFTCGAAALATILRYSFGLDVDEAQTTKGLFAVADPRIARERGFSFADMKAFLLRFGFDGDGFAFKSPSGKPGPQYGAPTPVAAIARLQAIVVPTIALINIEGYQHFVVIRRTTPETVFVADPALGNRRMPASDFAQAWNGVLFRVQGRGYRAGNALVAVELPQNSGQLFAGSPRLLDPLTIETLMEVGVAPTQRL